MRRSRWMWRWRRNPLRRRSYLVEAWVLLTVVLAATAGAVLAGSAVTSAVQHRLARQNLERHPTTAVLTKDASDLPGYASGPGAPVRWTAPDGSSHTDWTKVALGLKSGARVRVWTDARGELVPPPLTAPAARFEAILTGATAAGMVCAVALVGGGIAQRVTDRRRAEQWAAEWRVVGPGWDHRRA